MKSCETSVQNRHLLLQCSRELLVIRAEKSTTSEAADFEVLGPRVYLEGHGDLVSRLITPVTHIVTLVIPINNLLTKSP